MARLRIGVIGLGRRWPRYRHALLALKREARVVAVCDAAAAVAAEEAQRLGCAAAGSAIDLIERDDTDAVLLTGGSWFGLWPLEHAARAGKPVLCAGELAHERDADGLAARLADAPVHVTLWPTFELLAEAATQRLGDAMGAPRLALAGRVMTTGRDPLASDATLALLAGLADVFEASPRAVTASSPPGRPGFVNVLMEFDSGVAQLSLWAGPADVGRTWLDVDAEGGGLRAEMPRRLTWQDAEGRHGLELPAGLAEVWVVDRFVQAVRAGELPASFARAYQALTWLRAARASLAD